MRLWMRVLYVYLPRDGHFLFHDSAALRRLMPVLGLL